MKIPSETGQLWRPCCLTEACIDPQDRSPTEVRHEQQSYKGKGRLFWPGTGVNNNLVAVSLKLPGTMPGTQVWGSMNICASVHLPHPPPHSETCLSLVLAATLFKFQPSDSCSKKSPHRKHTGWTALFFLEQCKQLLQGEFQEDCAWQGKLTK